MVEEYAIAMDIGTSGVRAQAINVEDNSTISTTVTLRHPIPGANVMDHLLYLRYVLTQFNYHYSKILKLEI